MIVEDIEKVIWEGANILRGSIDTSSYKSVILTLLFLKFVSQGEEKDRKGIIVPEAARWNRIEFYSKSQSIGEVIDTALAALEGANPELKDVLEKGFSKEMTDKRKLGQLVDLFSKAECLKEQESLDVLGLAYEYCLRNFAEHGNKHAGEFYTPDTIVKLLVSLLRPQGGNIYDPCLGSGNLLVQAAAYIRSLKGDLAEAAFYGQDSNPTAWRLAKMNLAIRGICGNLGSKWQDTFFYDCHVGLKADYILANPPFNQSEWGNESLLKDPRWIYGIPSMHNGNYAWIQHMLSHLHEKGKMGIILSNGALSTSYSGEGDIRKKMIEADLVDCIVALPAQMFYNTQMPVSIWIFSKDKKQKGTTLFIDAEKLGYKISRRILSLSEEEIEQISGTYCAYEKGEHTKVVGFSAAATTEVIRENNYILTPSRYVGTSNLEDNLRLSEDRLNALMEELKQMFLESDRLQQDILKHMSSFSKNKV